MPIKFLVLGGGGYLGFLGAAGGNCRLYFYGREDFFLIKIVLLSVPKNRNRRKIAAFSNRKVLNRRFCRRKIAEKSPENRRRNRRKIASDFLGRGMQIAAFPRFQIAAFPGR